MANFGQHFLVNQSVIKKIAETLALQKGDTVIEIGAGHGELSSELVNWLIGENSDGKLILIEKDDALAEILRKNYGEDKKIEIINGDVLKILPELIHQLTNQQINYKLAGNIPYYITGKLLRLISELENKPSRCVFTLQKEVAERLAEKPPRMNRLAASVQFWAKPEIIEYVSRNDFKPAPEVDSAIVKLVSGIRYQVTGNITPEQYYRAVRMLFQQPRKTILNNLTQGAPKKPKNLIAQELEKIGINPADRPQNLSIEDIIAISRIVQHYDAS